MEYHSQFKQDEFLNESIFKNKENGVFVEIGADDGICHSNTLFFEKYKNWKGICIEPRKSAFEKLTKNRNCICENVCISEEEGVKDFTEFIGRHTQLSGLTEKYSNDHKKRIEKETKEFGLVTKTVNAECKNINNLLNHHGISKIDYFSIDTEGGELDILKSIDFDKVRIDIISIENNYLDLKIKKFLKSKNYKLIKKMRVDEIYMLKDSGLPDYKEPFNLKQTTKNLKNILLKKTAKITPEPIKKILRK